VRRLFVFDFDGVIADTGADIASAVMATQGHFGCNASMSEAKILTHVGYGAMHLLENTVMPFVSASSISKEEICSWYKQYYFEHCVEKTTLYEGVAETLERIALRGDSICMFTNKPSAVAHRSLTLLGVADRFEKVFCPEELRERKPSPEGILRCMEYAGISADKTVMIGDSAADIVAAKAAGVRSCGVLFGIGDQEKMLGEKPDVTVARFCEIMDI